MVGLLLGGLPHFGCMVSMLDHWNVANFHPSVGWNHWNMLIFNTKTLLKNPPKLKHMYPVFEIPCNILPQLIKHYFLKTSSGMLIYVYIFV